MPVKEFDINRLFAVDPLFKLLITDHVEQGLWNDLTDAAFDRLTLLFALLHTGVEGLAGILDTISQRKCLLGSACLQLNRASIRKPRREESIRKYALKFILVVMSEELFQHRDKALIKLLDVLNCELLTNELLPDERGQVDSQIRVCSDADTHQYSEEVVEAEVMCAYSLRIKREHIRSSDV